MVQGSNSATIQPLVQRNVHYRAVSRALRTLVGRGRRHTYKEVQRGAGVHERMLVAFKQDPDHEEWRPCGVDHFASLVCFLGADFTSEYLDGIAAGQAAYNLPDDETPPLNELAADAAEDGASLARMAVRGVDHDQSSQLQAIGMRMKSRGAGLVKLAHAA